MCASLLEKKEAISTSGITIFYNYLGFYIGIKAIWNKTSELVILITAVQLHFNVYKHTDTLQSNLTRYAANSELLA